MPSYLAFITVHADLDDDLITGIADVLGSTTNHRIGAGTVVFEVPGEAPDADTAHLAAVQHAAEVLDGYEHEVDVSEVRPR